MAKPKAASRNQPFFDKDRYWNGVFTGVFIGSFFLSLLLLIFIRVQGFKLAINPEQLARLVQAKVESQARQDIPQLFQGFKQELPGEVDKHLGGLDDLTIGFGQSQVKLPDEVLATIKFEFNRIIEESIANTLNDYDTSKYQERIGKSAYELVNQMLMRELIGKTYLIKTSQWFSVPVKIVISNSDQLQIGI